MGWVTGGRISRGVYRRTGTCAAEEVWACWEDDTEVNVGMKTLSQRLRGGNSGSIQLVTHQVFHRAVRVDWVDLPPLPVKGSHMDTVWFFPFLAFPSVFACSVEQCTRRAIPQMQRAL